MSTPASITMMASPGGAEEEAHAQGHAGGTDGEGADVDMEEEYFYAEMAAHA